MEFKALRTEDLSACVEAFVTIFNGEPWYDEWTLEGASQYLSDFYHTPQFRGLLAIQGKEIVGFIYGVTRSWWNGKEFYIHEMGVREEWRGKGVGKALLDKLSEEVKTSGVENLSLLTDRGMPAEMFYQKNGFKAIERLIFYSKDI